MSIHQAPKVQPVATSSLTFCLFPVLSTVLVGVKAQKNVTKTNKQHCSVIPLHSLSIEPLSEWFKPSGVLFSPGWANRNTMQCPSYSRLSMTVWGGGLQRCWWGETLPESRVERAECDSLTTAGEDCACHFYAPVHNVDQMSPFNLCADLHQ